MVDRLRRIVDLLAQEAERLPEEDQNSLAVQLEAITDSLRWDELLSDPAYSSAIDSLADEALEQWKVGKTRPLDEVMDGYLP